MPKTQKLKLHVMIESLDDHRRNKTFLTPIKIKIPDSHFLHDQTQSLIFSRHHWMHGLWPEVLQLSLVGHTQNNSTSICICDNAIGEMLEEWRKNEYLLGKPGVVVPTVTRHPQPLSEKWVKPVKKGQLRSRWFWWTKLLPKCLGNHMLYGLWRQ